PCAWDSPAWASFFTPSIVIRICLPRLGRSRSCRTVGKFVHGHLSSIVDVVLGDREPVAEVETLGAGPAVRVYTKIYLLGTSLAEGDQTGARERVTQALL